MKLNFEKQFTKQEYNNFVSAVEHRKDYEFSYGKHGDKMIARICGRFCDNGVWQPENYLWSISTFDTRDGYSGTSNPFRVSELKSYDEIIAFVYDRFNLPQPTTFQTSLFDLAI